MNRMTTIKGIRRRVLAPFAIAILLSLAGIFTPVQAQEIGSFYAFEGFQRDFSVGVARGETVRIVIQSTLDFSSVLKPSVEPDVIVAAGPSFGGHVKAFNASTGALLWSRELTGLTAGLQTIDINRDDLSEAGEAETSRLELWIEVVILPSGIRNGQMDDVIVVGVYNTSNR